MFVSLLDVSLWLDQIRHTGCAGRAHLRGISPACSAKMQSASSATAAAAEARRIGSPSSNHVMFHLRIACQCRAGVEEIGRVACLLLARRMPLLAQARLIPFPLDVPTTERDSYTPALTRPEYRIVASAISLIDPRRPAPQQKPADLFRTADGKAIGKPTRSQSTQIAHRDLDCTKMCNCIATWSPLSRQCPLSELKTRSYRPESSVSIENCRWCRRATARRRRAGCTAAP